MTDDLQPGTKVRVVDGTFAGMTGEVLSFSEAVALYESSGAGGERPSRHARGQSHVALTLFEHRIPVTLFDFQIETYPQ